MNKKTIWLTRHGETEWNKVRRMQGQMNSDLTDMGKKQAEWLRKWLDRQGVNIEVIYTSPLGRAVQTAEIIRNHREIPTILSEDLKEMYLGSWEGQFVEEVDRKYHEENHRFWHEPDLFRATDGEEFMDVRRRLQRFYEDVLLKDTHEHILIVAHAIVVKSFLAMSQGLPIAELWDGPHIKPTSVSKGIIEDGKIEYEYIALTEHYLEAEDEKAAWFIED